MSSVTHSFDWLESGRRFSIKFCKSMDASSRTFWLNIKKHVDFVRRRADNARMKVQVCAAVNKVSIRALTCYKITCKTTRRKKNQIKPRRILPTMSMRYTDVGERKKKIMNYACNAHVRNAWRRRGRSGPVQRERAHRDFTYENIVETLFYEAWFYY